MENTITDYDLDDYFRELSTKYKSREVQISRYLKNKISDKLNLKNVINKDMSYLSNVREIDLVNKASDSLKSAQDNLNAGFPVDVVEIDLKNAWDYLGEIMGMSYKDELVDKIFSNFCLGK